TRKKARLKQLEDAISRMQDEVNRRHGTLKQADVEPEMGQPVPSLSFQIAFGQLMRVKESLGKIEADLKTWQSEKASVEKKLTNVAAEVPPPPAGYADAFEHDMKMQTLVKRIESLNSRIDYLTKISGDPKLASVVELRQRVAEAQ